MKACVSEKQMERDRGKHQVVSTWGCCLGLATNTSNNFKGKKSLYYQDSNYYQLLVYLEAAKLAYAIKAKESITSQELQLLGYLVNC